MRIFLILFITTVCSLYGAKAQVFSPFGMSAYPGEGFITHKPQDSLHKNKWSVSNFRQISTGISFYHGGQATFFAAPMGIQLTRKLNDNVYAFGNIAVTPAFMSVHSLTAQPGSKPFATNPYSSKFNYFGVNPSVSMGLMYINEAKTFSISGSISAERSSYPYLPYYNLPNNRYIVPHSNNVRQ